MLNRKAKMALKLLSVSFMVTGYNIFGMDLNQDPNNNLDKRGSQNLQQLQNSNEGATPVLQPNNLDASDANATTQSLVFHLPLRQQNKTPANVFFQSMRTLLPECDELSFWGYNFREKFEEIFRNDADYTFLNKILSILKQMDNEGQFSDTEGMNIFQCCFFTRFYGGDELGALQLLLSRFPGISSIQVIIADNSELGEKLCNLLAKDSDWLNALLQEFEDELTPKAKTVLALLRMMFELRSENSISPFNRLGYVKSGQPGLTPDEEEQFLEKEDKEVYERFFHVGNAPMVWDAIGVLISDKVFINKVNECFGSCNIDEQFTIRQILRRCNIVAQLCTDDEAIDPKEWTPVRDLLSQAKEFSEKYDGCSICSAVSSSLFGLVIRDFYRDFCYILEKINGNRAIVQPSLKFMEYFSKQTDLELSDDEVQLTLGIFWGALKQAEIIKEKEKAAADKEGSNQD